MSQTVKNLFFPFPAEFLPQEIFGSFTYRSKGEFRPMSVMAEFGYDRNDNREFPLCSTARILNTGRNKNKLPKWGGNLDTLCKFGTAGGADSRTGCFSITAKHYQGKSRLLQPPFANPGFPAPGIISKLWFAGISSVWALHLGFGLNLVSPLLRIKGWKLWHLVPCSAWGRGGNKSSNPFPVPEGLQESWRGTSHEGMEW